MKKIICCIPLSWDFVPKLFFTNVLDLIKNTKCDIGFLTQNSCYMDQMRDKLADEALRHNPDYILWLDADQTYPPHTITTLMNHVDNGKQVVGGLTPRRPDGVPLIYNIVHPEGIIRNDLDFRANQGLVKIDAMGFGGVMTHPDVFKIIESPYFQMCWNFKIAINPGEDIKFYANCKKFGIDVWCDTDLVYDHLATKPIKLQSGSYYNSIPGWMTEEEVRWLYLAAQDMENIVEIGSYKGRSTHALLSGCSGTVWAIDHFQGSPGEPPISPEKINSKEIYGVFMKNVGRFENLKLLKMSSKEAVKEFKDNSIDMVFIDGAHSFEAAKADLEMWLPKAKKIICGHDYNIPGVERAVKQVFGNVNTCQSIWIKEI